MLQTTTTESFCQWLFGKNPHCQEKAYAVFFINPDPLITLCTKFSMFIYLIEV